MKIAIKADLENCLQQLQGTGKITPFSLAWQTRGDRLLKSPQSFQLLKLYQEVLQLGEVRAKGSPEEKELLLSGIVINQQGFLRVNNRIYTAVFDLNWVEANLLTT